MAILSISFVFEDNIFITTGNCMGIIHSDKFADIGDTFSINGREYKFVSVFDTALSAFPQDGCINVSGGYDGDVWVHLFGCCGEDPLINPDRSISFINDTKTPLSGHNVDIGLNKRKWHPRVDGEPSHKTCRRCGKTKPVDEFYRYFDKRYNKHYRRFACLECMKLYDKEHKRTGGNK